MQATSDRYPALRLTRIVLASGAALGLALGCIVGGFIWWPFSLVGLLLVGLFHWWTQPGRRFDHTSWLKGLEGELAISPALDLLFPLGYRALGAVDVGRGDVDHFVVGPTGAFAIEVKNWSKPIRMTRESLPIPGSELDKAIKQAIRGAIAMRKELELRWVEAVVVLVNQRVPNDPFIDRGVTVCSGARLNAVITDHRQELNTDDIDRVVAALAPGTPAKSSR